MTYPSRDNKEGEDCMNPTITEMERPKTKGELRLEKIWERWRDERAMVSAQLTTQKRRIEELQRVGLDEDLPNSLLERTIRDESVTLSRITRRYWAHMARCAWLFVITALSPMLIPVSDRLDNWMSNPDPHRQ